MAERPMPRSPHSTASSSAAGACASTRLSSARTAARRVAGHKLIACMIRLAPVSSRTPDGGRLRAGGRLVANVGSIESLSIVHQTLARLSKDVNVWMINVARGTHQLERVRFEALNPTFLLAVVKPNSSLQAVKRP